jgi:AraC-like DNA-binding protein
MHETNNCIEEHYSDDITVEDIADHIGLNRSYFGKLFKKETGQTPQAFLINYRMVKACEYLVQSNMSVADVASAVGYNNPLHFSRAFKNVYQISPLNYRKKNKKY